MQTIRYLLAGHKLYKQLSICHCLEVNEYQIEHNVPILGKHMTLISGAGVHVMTHIG